MRTLVATLVVCLLVLPTHAQYSGGSGTADDPYQIATPEDLILLGETPDDYDKHFILTADIDLDPDLPGRKVFDRAVIAPHTGADTWVYTGRPFAGVFDGNDNTIWHLTIQGDRNLGLFGLLASGARVSGLRLEMVNINATNGYTGGLVGDNNGFVAAASSTGTIIGEGDAGGLAGHNDGIIVGCHSAAEVSGERCVGGLVATNSGSVTESYSTGRVNGDDEVGGLVGWNRGSMVDSYSRGAVAGNDQVGGLVGGNGGSIAMSHSTGAVSGGSAVGGLAGRNEHRIRACHSTCMVDAESTAGGLVGLNSSDAQIVASYSQGTVSGNQNVGGLVGSNSGNIVVSYSACAVGADKTVAGFVAWNSGNIVTSCSSGPVSGTAEAGGFVGLNDGGNITASFWDVETSGHSISGGGIGLTTADMQNAGTFHRAGWDFAGEIANGTCDYWQVQMDDYPGLCWQSIGSPAMPEGLGTAEVPYLIRDARDLGTVWWEPTAHYRLEASVDLTGTTWSMAVVPWFGGVFDGNGQVIAGLEIQGGGRLGLIGELALGAEIADLDLAAVSVHGTGAFVGGLAGSNWGSITGCSSVGTVSGRGEVGGLVGRNDSLWHNGQWGRIADCQSTGAVVGGWWVGGLVGYNMGDVTTSRCAGLVGGGWGAGGLVGGNLGGSIRTSLSTAAVDGFRGAGGLVGINVGLIATSYSTSAVTGDSWVGGLVGQNDWQLIDNMEFCARVVNCYSAGPVVGNEHVGGLVGWGAGETEADGFWNVETSGLLTSHAGAGRTTAEMQTAATFLDAGWDFVCEAANGTEDIWYMPEGDYPRLVWELEEVPPCPAVVIEVDATNFSETIADGVVLVGFYATWCPHCRTQAPILDDVAEQVQGQAAVAKLDIDKSPSVAQQYNVGAIPTLIVFRYGHVFERFVGVTQAPELVAAIDAAIESQARPPARR